MKKLTKLMLILAQLGLVGAVQAASVSLSPNNVDSFVGDTVSFSVVVDFSDVATDGGGFLINYDAGFLGDATFTYSSGLPGSIDVSNWDPYLQTGSVEVGFDANDGFGGIATLGTMSFSVLTTGSSNIVLTDTAPAWRFIDTNHVNFIDVNYSGATVNAISEVPVPAALWLMASGLSFLGIGLRRRAA